MFAKIILLYGCCVFAFIESAFVDTILKCSIKDSECLKKAYSDVIVSIGKTGIPEYDVPPIDPIALKDVTLSVAGLIDLTLKEGTVSGVTGCRYNYFTLDIEKEKGKTEIICNLVIEGIYKVSSASPVIKTFLNGSSIHGEGNGKVTLEKIVLDMEFPFYASKRDGEIYLTCDYKSSKFDYEVKGKIKFEADKLYLGDKEASKEVVELLNTNWKFVVASAGRSFAEKALELYVLYSSKFFNKVPARNFITDDLTPYARS